MPKLNKQLKTRPNHTLLPWSVNKAGGISGDGEVIILNDLDWLLEDKRKPVNDGFGHAKDNVEFIVRACNSHYALIDACERLVSTIDNTGGIEGDGVAQDPDWVDLRDSYDLAKAALAMIKPPPAQQPSDRCDVCKRRKAKIGCPNGQFICQACFDDGHG